MNNERIKPSKFKHEIPPKRWIGLNSIHPKKYKCSYCGSLVANNKGYEAEHSSGSIYICPNCNEPTYFDIDKQIPGAKHGEDVKNLPDDINSLYNEARNCISVSSYTASVMICRKLLMNIAVNKGADKGKTYKEYVNYLDVNHYTPPESKDWVDKIRELGNEANHEIKLMSNEVSVELLNFVEMLLKFIYEYPTKFKKQ